MTIIGVLAAAAMPAVRVIQKRERELELKRILLEVRTAIDRFKQAVDAGEIEVNELDQLGYPADFDQMIKGVGSKKHPGQNLKFLRRIPVDPMTGEALWGMRSVQDEPDTTSWGGQNLFDIYSLSDGTALDGSEYSSW
ncbi:MAG: type II secretion system protein [Acidobacteria bacterium]|nr:type II secretion system protein [Acidobacteriota bacterium]